MQGIGLRKINVHFMRIQKSKINGQEGEKKKGNY